MQTYLNITHFFLLLRLYFARHFIGLLGTKLSFHAARKIAYGRYFEEYKSEK